MTMPFQLQRHLITAMLSYALFASACFTGPSSPYLDSAQEAMLNRQWAQAQAILEQANSTTDLNRNALELLARAHRQQGEQAYQARNFEAAAHHFLEAAAHEPSRNQRNEDFLRAIQSGKDAFMPAHQLASWADRAVANLSNSHAARAHAAYLWDESNDPERAIEHFLWLWEADRSQLQIGFRLGILYMSLGRYEDANATFERLLFQDPYHVQASINRAEVLEKLKKYEEAHLVFEKLLEIHPENAGILIRYANFLDRRGFASQAAQARERAHQSMPGVERRELRPLR